MSSRGGGRGGGSGKKFMPNLKAAGKRTLVVKEETSESATPSTSKSKSKKDRNDRRGGRGGRGGSGGHQQREYVQDTGIFEAGYNGSSSSQRFDSGNSGSGVGRPGGGGGGLRTPKLEASGTSSQKINKLKDTDTGYNSDDEGLLKELLRSDFVSDKIGSESQPLSEVSPQKSRSNRKQESLAEALQSTSEGGQKLMLVQMSTGLSQVFPTSEANEHQQASSTADPDVKIEPPEGGRQAAGGGHSLSGLPTGTVGKLVIRQSGKVCLRIGKLEMDLEEGILGNGHSQVLYATLPAYAPTEGEDMGNTIDPEEGLQIGCQSSATISPIPIEKKLNAIPRIAQDIAKLS